MKKLFIFLLLSFSLFYCAKKVFINVTKPALYNVSDLKRIAVLDFTGSGNSSKIIANKFANKLWKTNYFSVMERQELQKILEEQALQMTGVVNDSMAVEFGKIIGVNGLILGDVFSYKIDDNKGKEKVKEKVWTGKYEKDSKGKVIYEKTSKGKKEKKKEYKEVLVDREYVQRQVTVGISFRLVSVETGEIRASDSQSKSFNKKYYPKRDKIPSGNAILDNLSENILDSFIPLISPHEVRVSKTFEKDNDAVDLGIEMAQNNLWDKAKDIWKKEIDKNPRNTAAIYNLGIAFEVLGDLDLAEKTYERALDIEPKEIYMEALSNIRKRKVEKENLDRQLMNDNDQNESEKEGIQN